MVLKCLLAEKQLKRLNNFQACLQTQGMNDAI